MSNKKKISFCITCKGRLEHLKQTLPENLKNTERYPNVEFVVLDYDSQDGLEEWIRKNYQPLIDSGKIRYTKYTPAPEFQMAHAKNMAHRVATGEILCNLDADNIVHRHFAGWLNKQFSENPNIYIRPSDLLVQTKRLVGDPQRGASGRIAIHRDNFMRLHGYNQNFKGWGNDDGEFVSRADHAGLTGVPMPWYMVGHVLQHSNEKRIENLDEESKKTSGALLNSSRLSRFAKMTVSLSSSLSVNPDGDFGCGKVRINFKEDVTLEPHIDKNYNRTLRQSSPRLSR